MEKKDTILFTAMSKDVERFLFESEAYGEALEWPFLTNVDLILFSVVYSNVQC